VSLKHVALVVFALLVQASAPALAEYPYGILPSGADPDVVRVRWAEYRQLYVTPIGCPDPQTMLRVGHDTHHAKSRTAGEGHGYGMVFTAYLDNDDTTLTKLWN